MPLQVSVFAKGQPKAALQLGFTKLSYNTPVALDVYLHPAARTPPSPTRTGARPWLPSAPPTPVPSGATIT